MESPHKPAPDPAITIALAEAAASHPYTRKLLVSRRQGEGREVLRALTATGTAWLGFEVTTPWQLAQSLVGDKLAERGLRVVDEFDQAALLDESIDSVLSKGGGRLAALAEGAGLRRSIANAVQALRLAGIDGAGLARTRFRDEDKRVQLSRILTAYERLMDRRKLTDRAGVFRLAVASLAVHEVGVADAIVYLMPGQLQRGLSGQLLSVLIEQGATVLPASPVFGLPVPAMMLRAPSDGRATGSRLAWLHDVRNASPSTGDVSLSLFAASSMRAELREVLRRTIGMGLRWDQIEILATDPVAYGVALDELTQRSGIPVSYAVGLPTSRTRPGRAVAKYLEWIQQDFPSDILRGMLERGDIAPPSGDATGVALARRLRRMKIGRGRSRYVAALTRAARALELPPRDDDERSPEEIADARVQEREAIAGLQSIIEPLAEATPDLPGRFDDASVMVQPASLARGVLALLTLVPLTTSVDRTAHDKLTARLERFAATATRATTLDAAISILVGKLDERVPAPDAIGGAPWSSAGSHIHLTDLEQGGHTGRAATFIVGLDAVRFPGTGVQDALLVDDDRRRISEETAGSGLPTATERVEEKRYALAMLLSRLGGTVTLSYSTWDAVEGRAIPPAAELLQAYRLMVNDATADYDALHRALAPAASVVPRAESALLDSDDVWLSALTEGGVLRYGIPSVRATYPGFDAGINAGRALKGPALTAHHGLITPRIALDPRVNESLVVSSTQLQTLGTCPHRYLLRYVMRVKKPDDPDTSVEAWLSPLERGSLLHSVFERTLKAFNENRAAIETDEFDDRAMRTLDDELDMARDRLPPPGDAIFQIEAESLREDVRAFMAMVREDGARWIDVERKFGRDGAPPIQITVGPSKIMVNGAIDRVDRLPDDSLMIVDYKTGSRHRFGGKTGDYDGGRRLQHVLYAAVAERLYDGQVSRAEFQFPSRKSENHRAVYRRPVITGGLPIVSQLLDMLKAGQLYATNDVDDCKFCDYAAVCRVRVSDYGDVKSMMAEWSREGSDPALSSLRQLRGG